VDSAKCQNIKPFAKFTKKRFIIYFDHVFKQLWESIGKFIKGNIQQDISATLKDIIFGYFDFDPDKTKACFCYQFNLFYWEILYP